MENIFKNIKIETKFSFIVDVWYWKKLWQLNGTNIYICVSLQSSKVLLKSLNIQSIKNIPSFSFSMFIILTVTIDLYHDWKKRVKCDETSDCIKYYKKVKNIIKQELLKWTITWGNLLKSRIINVWMFLYARQLP